MSEEHIKPEDQGGEKTIDYSTYEQTKNDMHKFKREALETQKKLQEFQLKMEQMEQERLENSQQYKELYEKKAKEAEELREREKNLQQSIVYDKKYNALLDAARREGLKDAYVDWLDNVDYDDIVLETTSTGRYEVIGVNDKIASFKEKYPDIFNSKHTRDVNNSTGSSDIGEKKKLSSRELLDLEKKDYAAYLKYRQEQSKQR